MSQLAKCSVCGHITDDFVRYGNIFHADEYPNQCPCACSSECQDIVAEKMLSDEWALPKLKKSHGGYCHDISKPRRGYDAQPSQDDLIKQLLTLAKQP